MSDNVIIPIAIWQARRDRQAQIKREQWLIEQLERLSDADLNRTLRDLDRARLERERSQ